MATSRNPRLRCDLEVFPGGDSGDGTVILKDPITERFVRLDVLEHRFLALLDGTRTLAQARIRLQDQGRFLSQQEAEHVFARATELGLVLDTTYGTAAHLTNLRDQLEQARSGRGLSRLFFFYIPLFNPDRFLERTLWIYHLVANRWTGALMALLTPGALFLGLAGLDRMDREYSYFFHWKALLYLWITMVLAKIFHELAHAYVAKSYGLRVPQVGMAVMVFWPFLFCDTTHVWQLPSRWQRIAVSAAGVIAETALAILAIWVWGFTRPGILNSLALYMAAVSLASTVLVNANPLMRRDGYFVLIDLLGIPNLAKRSAEELRYAFLNQVLGIHSVRPASQSPGEAFLFLAFGAGSFLYRIVISLSIIGIVYFQFDKMLGAFLAFLALMSMMVTPAIGGMAGLAKRGSEIRPRLKGVLICLLAGGLGLLAVSVPLTTRSVYPCFLVAPRTQELTLPLRTRVTETRVREGSHVKAGDVLFALDTRELELELLKKQLERDLLKREHELALIDDELAGKAPTKAVEIFRVEDGIAHIEAKLAEARAGVVAPFDGVVTRLDPRMQPGYRPDEGTRVGEFEATGGLRVHALVPGEDRHHAKIGQEVEIWLPLEGRMISAGRVTEVRSYGEEDLRDSPFSSAVGGELATEVRDRKETPLEDQFICVAEVAGAPLPPHSGMTGRMALPQPPRSLYRIVIDNLIQTFNRESVL